MFLSMQENTSFQVPRWLHGGSSKPQKRNVALPARRPAFFVQNEVSYITIYDYCDLLTSGIFDFGRHLIYEIEVGVSHLQ